MCLEVGFFGTGVDGAGDEGCLGGHGGAEVRVVDEGGEGGLEVGGVFNLG